MDLSDVSYSMGTLCIFGGMASCSMDAACIVGGLAKLFYGCCLYCWWSGKAVLWILLVLLLVWQSKTCGIVKPELPNSLHSLTCNVPAAWSMDLSSSKGSSLPVRMNAKQFP